MRALCRRRTSRVNRTSEITRTCNGPVTFEGSEKSNLQRCTVNLANHTVIPSSSVHNTDTEVCKLLLTAVECTKMQTDLLTCHLLHDNRPARPNGALCSKHCRLI